LELTSHSFVLPDLQEIHSDLVYQCRFEQKPGYIYFLFEHNSTPEELATFYTLFYVMNLLYDCVRQGKKRLPIILPIYIYHGAKSPYPYSRNIYDCFEYPALARKLLILKLLHLIDLTVFSKDEIYQHGTASLMEFLFKNVRTRDFFNEVRALLAHGTFRACIIQLDQFDPHYSAAMLRYVLLHTDQSCNWAQEIVQTFIEAFPNKRGEFMTCAEQLIQEGMQKGMLQKELEISQQMLYKGLDRTLIQECTHLSDEELDKLLETIE
jgi:predicted transposase YdaD